MSNLTLEWWWMCLLLPLPLIFRHYRRAHAQAAIMLPHASGLNKDNAPQSAITPIVLAFAWSLLVVAACRPVWLGEAVEFHPKHRDMMLVVDLSYSMSKKDMRHEGEYIDRLSAVKNVVSDFIDKRKGDRVGLVLFADHAYLQTPLTLDRDTVREQLNQTVLKLIGTQTAIGDGIGLATKTFIDGDAPQRVMILLSDGGNTAGVIDPLEAANIAKKYNTTIYTIGVGAGEMQVNDFFMTRTVNTADDLDEDTLTQVAEITGGRYFRAKDAKQLHGIYETINQLQPISTATQSWRPQTEWFGLPLAVSMILFVFVIVRRR
jgi:Ca-activated chloride channel family protein